MKRKSWKDRAVKVGRDIILWWFWFVLVALATGFMDAHFNINVEDVRSGLVQGAAVLYISATLHKLADKKEE